LRACVDFANAFPDTGDPSANNYIVTLPAGTITLDPNRATLEIGSNMQINGDSQSPTPVQRSGTNEVFRLFEVDAEMSVSFANMTLQGGAGRLGGAIKVDPSASVKIDTCTLQNNTATAANGF